MQRGADSAAVAGQLSCATLSDRPRDTELSAWKSITNCESGFEQSAGGMLWAAGMLVTGCILLEACWLAAAAGFGI